MKLTLCFALLLSPAIQATTIFSPGGYSTVDLTLASNPADWSTLYTVLHANPGPDSTASVNYSQSVITAGDVRPGYLQITGGGSVSYFELGSATVTSGFAGGPIDARIYHAASPSS